MSLRARVALAAALSTVIVVVAAGLGLLVLVRRDEGDRLDDQLERQAEQIAQPGTLALVLRDRRFQRAPPRPDLLVLTRILDGDETLLVSEDFPTLPAETDVGFSTESVDGESWRVLTTVVERPRREGGDPLAVQVTVSMAGVDETVAELRRLLLLVGAVAVGAAGLGGWLLGSVAIRPLSRLRSEAERVSGTADLSLRVPTDRGPRLEQQPVAFRPRERGGGDVHDGDSLGHVSGRHDRGVEPQGLGGHARFSPACVCREPRRTLYGVRRSVGEREDQSSVSCPVH